MKEEKASPLTITPKAIVRTLLCLLVSPMIYKETGIVTTLLFAMMYVELAVTGDWLDITNKLIKQVMKNVDYTIKFQNEFIVQRMKQNGKSKSTD